MSKKRINVNASEIGRAVYCPRALQYQLQGIKPNRNAKARINHGNVRHEQFNQAVQLSGSRRCYVATAYFGECDRTTLFLRHYRDTTLSQHKLGRCLISTYYTLSPYLLTITYHLPFLDRPIKSIINRIVRYLGGPI